MSFHSSKAIRKCKVEKRSNEIVNRLNKTKREAYPDLAARREAFDQVGLCPVQRHLHLTCVCRSARTPPGRGA